MMPLGAYLRATLGELEWLVLSVELRVSCFVCSSNATMFSELAPELAFLWLWSCVSLFSVDFSGDWEWLLSRGETCIKKQQRVTD